jgi:serine protease Do
VVRGWLGVVIQDVSQEIAKGFGLDEARGALVGDVMKDGPADKAGLQRGDVIITFDGTPVDNVNTLRNVVARTEVDKNVDVIVIRSGEETTITVTVGEQDAEKVAGIESPAESSQKSGVTVQDLTPEIAKQFGLEDEEGVIISDVESGSPAAEAGLRRGDLIKEVNREPVTSLAEYNTAMENVADEDDNFLLLIKRSDSTFYVVVNIE